MKKLRIARRRFLAGTVCSLAGATGIGYSRSRPSAASSAQSQLKGASKRTFRFAAAMQPRVEQIFPSKRWLEAISHAGYTHLFLQVDPFVHQEENPDNKSGLGLSLISVFDMTDGPVSHSYQSWLGAVSETVSQYGLKLGMELWEPHLPPYARRVMPADWIGPAPHNKSGDYTPLCVSQPAARAWLLRGFQKVLECAPEMNTFALGTNDNDSELCNERCPRCGGSVSIQERFSSLYRDIDSACRQVRSDFELIPYDWEWPDSYFDVTLSKLPKATLLLTRLERFALVTPDPAQPQWHGHVYDQSLGCDQVGPGFRRAQTAATSRGDNVLVMSTLSGMFEGWQLPYVPAAGQIAKKFDRMRTEKCDGWVDYDCGGIHEGLVLDLVDVVQHNAQSSVEEWLRLLATRRYGNAKSVGVALDCWQAFDAGVQVFPAVLDFESIDNFSGRFGVAVGLLPMHPFIKERAEEARDARSEHLWFDPHNFLTREALPAVRHCMKQSLLFARRGWTHSQRLLSQTPASHRANADFDTTMAELTCLYWQSIANFYEWAAFVQGDKSVPIIGVLRSEIELVQRYRDLERRPELQIGNMTWIWETEVARSLRLEISASTRQFAESFDFYGWKLFSLQQQLKDL